ncbi:hypothetical protein AVEN_206174-1 [Araneus ventricosus]|uniref:Uncharacterized protein n=1 Tax=Araneus ventricosus TaxID=182803 RepID=A0A4Y2EEJ3_ARAVE|nr:hypothetical protein AVEN_206174-1 [Araneus ventricosus]
MTVLDRPRNQGELSDDEDKICDKTHSPIYQTTMRMFDSNEITLHLTGVQVLLPVFIQLYSQFQEIDYQINDPLIVKPKQAFFEVGGPSQSSYFEGRLKL